MALPAAEVLEVIDMPEVASVPLAPAGLLGQCEWRGQTLPVLDAYALTGVPQGGTAAREALPGSEGVVLVMLGTSGAVALRVDDVEQVMDVDPAAQRDVPPGIDRGARLASLLRTADGLVSVLDLGVLRAAAEAILRGGARA